MEASRIQAVDNVVREAAIGLADALRWFYVEVGGLEDSGSKSPNDSLLCFRSGGLELRIRLVADPRVDTTGHPLVLAVPSLELAAEQLEERSVACEMVSGISWADGRLATNDPAGNRVELKREWPYDLL